MIYVGYPLGDSFIVVGHVVEPRALHLSERRLVDRARIGVAHFVSVINESGEGCLDIC